MGYLANIFEATEEENRRTILDTVLPRPGARFLDLGCADGAVTLRIAERVGAGEVHGVELIPELAEQARAAGVTVVGADLGEPLPFPDASFDVVHSNQVIEHLSGTDVFMREIRRVLRPDGYAIVSTNNLASWHNIGALVLGYQPTPCHVSDERIIGNPANFVAGSEGSRGQMHLRIFTGRALAELAALHGLDAEVQRTAGYYPFPPRIARRLTRVDPLHGAFLVQRYRVSERA
jgi:SAM-dependent methyltransferase